jgi:hypothetical protein
MTKLTGTNHIRRTIARATSLLLALATSIALATAAPGCPAHGSDAHAGAAPKEEWVSIFNGKDLEGWTVKMRGYDAGENYGDTFRVENGILKVSYDKYPDGFGNRFAHLFYNERLSSYRLRVEYRFVGEQCPGGPEWGLRNSGVMLHTQSPQSMRKDQEFPVSIEAQFLGGTGNGPRSTANLCTPGTNVVMNGKLFTPHCVNSTSKTYDGDQWVTVEVEVHGNGTIKHIVEGKTVIEYSQPQLDPTDADARKLMEGGAKKMLDGGYIALQAESHPLEIRKVELMRLSK